MDEIKIFYGEVTSLVFGCGGDRDYKKRPLMAKIANKYCQKIYVTDDNPRNEKPENIRKEIVKHINKGIYFNIGNRTQAIRTAILNASPNEIIVVAGKGHETQQIYKNKVLNISDKKIIKKIKLKFKTLSSKEKTFSQNRKVLTEINRKKA